MNSQSFFKVALIFMAVLGACGKRDLAMADDIPSFYQVPADAPRTNGEVTGLWAAPIKEDENGTREYRFLIEKSRIVAANRCINKKTGQIDFAHVEVRADVDNSTIRIFEGRGLVTESGCAIDVQIGEHEVHVDGTTLTLQSKKDLGSLKLSKVRD